MGRWVPDAQGRLIQAAIELFSDRGFEQVTVAQIAARAGLTERTFYRYFSDKREVLFFGSDAFEAAMVEALQSAAESLVPVQAVAVAVESIASFFEDRRSYAQRRQAIIDANAELQERERRKMGAIAVAMAAALERRGTKSLAAKLAAEMGVAVFRLAFDHWLIDPLERDYAYHVRDAFAALKTVTEGVYP